MSQLTVDLSGQMGLAPTFAGDLNSTVASPQLRYVGQAGQLADGIYDPLRVQGYMSPSNNTYTAVTGTITNKFAAVEYSASADTVYLAQNGLVLSTMAGLDATSISNTTVLSGQSTFKDLEMYMINGQESVFYSYLYADSSVTNQTKVSVGFKSVDSTKGAFELAAQVYETGVAISVEGIADGTAFAANLNYNRSKLSQKFLTADFVLPNDAKISGVRLRLVVPFTVAQTWTLKVGIQGDSGGFPDGVYVTNASTTVAASTLPSGSPPTATHLLGDYAYVWFQFPATVTLTSSTTYHLVIEPTVAASTMGVNQGVVWLASSFSTSLYANGQAEWLRNDIIADASDTTDIITITSPTTLAQAGIVQGTNLVYVSPTTGGLVNGTTYYVGTISGQTFKLYTDVHLSNLVNITVSLGGIQFNLAPSYPNIAFDNAVSSASGLVTSYTFNSAATNATNGMALLFINRGAIANTATWGGVSMTKIITNNTDSIDVFMMPNPANGVASIVITLGGTGNVNVTAITYSNCSQVTSPDNSATHNAASAAGISQTITPVADKAMAIMMGYSYSAPTTNLTCTTGLTSRIKANGMTIGDSNTPISPAASYSMAMTLDSGGTKVVGNVIVTLAPSTSTQINPATGYWFSQTSSFDFALILNQYNNIIGSYIQNPLNVFEESGDDNIFLHSAQNGFLYLFTDSRVGKFDGGDTGGGFGTFTPDVLTFPSYIRAIDAVDTNSLVYIGIEDSKLQTPEQRTFPANTIGVYAWDYQSVLASIRNYYPAPGARNIKRMFLNTDGNLRLITIGEDGFTELRGLANGQFQVLYKMGLNSYPAHRDALGYMNNMVVWLGADGIQYLFGKIRPESNETLYKIGNVGAQATGTLTPGLIYVGNKTSTQSRDGMLIAYDDTSPTANKLVRWYPHGVGTISSVAQTGNAGNVYTLALRFPSATAANGSVDPVTLAKVHYIRVYHAPVGAAGATVYGTISTYLNQSTVAARVDNVTAADIAKGYQYVNVGQALLSGVFMIQFKLTWVTSNTLSTSTDWMPRLIEMNYDEITKRF